MSFPIWRFLSTYKEIIPQVQTQIAIQKKKANKRNNKKFELFYFECILNGPVESQLRPQGYE